VCSSDLSQILEHDILLQQAMGPDDDIHDAGVYTLHDFLLLLLRLQTIQDLYAGGTRMRWIRCP
jgi:hypothetical protein